ncbi:MAG: GIY-YIG nuclease family protein, partial [Floccifex sp.]
MEIYFTKYKDLEDKNSSPVHIKNYVKKQIRDSTELTPQSKEVLLKYPVVYVHAWKNGFGRYSIYVGETNNLSERIRQHVQSAQDTIDWHSEWVEAINNGEAFSWFFSSDKMNKSMSLDLENSLVKLIQTQLKKSLIDLETKATSVQKDYNNKTDRNNLLEKIWFTLSEFNGFGFEDYNDLDKSSLSSSVIANSLLTNEFEFEVIQPINKDDTIAQISRVCKDKSLLLNYPMVYIFVWEKNGLLKTYVGETEKLCARTEQHLEMKEQWEKDWVEAIPEARLLLFGHKSFNKSMTLEIENRLVLYTKFLKCSQNSRHNEQGMYNNQNEMFNIFQLIISKLVSWQNGFTTDFQTLEDVQKNCMALASPFYKLTEGQSTIKNQIVEKVNSLLENEKNEGKKQLIILYGGAGTGKTMLLSSLLFSLYEQDNCKCDLVVNNQELAPTYQNMIEVWRS